MSNEVGPNQRRRRPPPSRHAWPRRDCRGRPGCRGTRLTLRSLPPTPAGSGRRCRPVRCWGSWSRRTATATAWSPPRGRRLHGGAATSWWPPWTRRSPCVTTGSGPHPGPVPGAADRGRPRWPLISTWSPPTRGPAALATWLRGRPGRQARPGLSGPRVHLGIDSGMGRGGFAPERAVAAARRLLDAGLALAGTWSHLATPEDPVVTAPPGGAVRDSDRRTPGGRHRARAPAPGRHGRAAGRTGRPYDMARVGLAFYGVVPPELAQADGLGAVAERSGPPWRCGPGRQRSRPSWRAAPLATAAPGRQPGRAWSRPWRWAMRTAGHGPMAPGAGASCAATGPGHRPGEQRRPGPRRHGRAGVRRR